MAVMPRKSATTAKLSLLPAVTAGRYGARRGSGRGRDLRNQACRLPSRSVVSLTFFAEQPFSVRSLLKRVRASRSILWALLAVACSAPVSAAGPAAPAAASPPAVQTEFGPGCTRGCQLAGLRVGPAGKIVTPEELRILLGRNLGGQDPQQELDKIEIETRASPGIPEQPAQEPVPFGLAGLAWGIRHPDQSWRLFFPVLAK
jgi:hypothetical protein